MHFLSALCLLFIGAKLFGVIAWSWLWVLAPLWIPLLSAVVVFVIAGIVVAIRGDYIEYSNYRKWKGRL